MNLELWRTNIKLPEEQIDSLIREVKESTIPFRNQWTTFAKPNQPTSISRKFYEDIMLHASHDLGLGFRLDGTFNYWVQVYGNNAIHPVHDHVSGVTLFSWVHFVRPTKEKCFCFVDSDMRPYFPEQNPGDFIIFPEWALHMVKPNKSGELRAVVAGNMNYRKMARPNGNKNVDNVITGCPNDVLVFQTVENNDNSLVDWSKKKVQWDNPLN